MEAAFESVIEAHLLGCGYSSVSPRCEKLLDVVLSLNGIPIGTLELKNPMANQTVEHAMKAQ
jgi:type I site-specific restriction-modification system R (restriction) subunit